MRVTKLTSALAACGAATAMLSAPAAPATAATAGAALAQAVERDSVTCVRPTGRKTNYSWKDGNSSTTVYFNNHCSHRVYAELHFKGPAGTRKECLATNGGTEGKKKFRKGLAENLTRITKDC
ncbi:hypothetical protein FE391_12220 [Nonomuraea sp. KC401]|uniref:hypothetical protein n=1 Tax=unclassified Nonomuraea TaxID=2593643 RepID=UPI0010FF01B5|nr:MULTISPECIES: hypothetical protein [unclassified Nonomuraea]NBE95935.1 hypothetical protein [Nonomuraea sp. K271]TLF76266.1 hypothetical protein FE391_12220 [Nonomuraea sp. KC401]